MPRNRRNLTLHRIWDLEDRYTALAGSASGRTVVVPRSKAETVSAGKADSSKKGSCTGKVIHAVAEGIKAGLIKGGIYKEKETRGAAAGSRAKKSKLTRGQRMARRRTAAIG